ncbi:MFS transporter [Pseudomonas sp. SLFW]|nr:MFS transporter [Pseudomonas sp. SLFW]
MTHSSSRCPLQKIVVAIHGVGSQTRSDTIRTVAHRFGCIGKQPPPVMPLGFFQLGNVGEVHLSRLEVDAEHELSNIGFAEVYWADIPRTVVTQGDTLEESKAWGNTIVARAQAMYCQKVPQQQPKLDGADFALTAGVTEEIIEAITLMENLAWVFKKLGLFEINISSLLADYLGDVQLVAEFHGYRQLIVNRFHDAMTQLLERFEGAYSGAQEIYIVAHSEGTVISFLALLEALSSPVGRESTGENGRKITYRWVQYVRGFMTLGSPIDKHLLLWPKLWPSDRLDTQDYPQKGKDQPVAFVTTPSETRVQLPSQIKWRNYYDCGDPIGFQLDSARKYLKKLRCDAFEFETRHDIGFTRYWFPGKAHIDYWNDSTVFRHFVDDVVLYKSPTAAVPVSSPPAPKTRPFVGAISLLMPYLLSVAMHATAVYIMLKSVVTFLAQHNWSALMLGQCVVSLSILLTAVTVSGRLPRLVKRSESRWRLLAFLIFAAGGGISMAILPTAVADFLAGPLVRWDVLRAVLFTWTGPFILLAACGCIASSGWWVRRIPRMGRKLMVGLGVLMITVAIAMGYLDASAQATVSDSAVAESPALWPLILSALAFIYLWWLGIVTFDLAFIWHRYIRSSVALDNLRSWDAMCDAPPRTLRKRRAG